MRILDGSPFQYPRNSARSSLRLPLVSTSARMWSANRRDENWTKMDQTYVPDRAAQSCGGLAASTES